MILRAPSYPLITVDPYFSVWSSSDKLTDTDTVHWTARNNTLLGTACIDGETYRFMGLSREGCELPAMKQTSVDFDALSTTYTFEAAGIELTAIFSTPLLPTKLDILSRPVSFLEVIARSLDHEDHEISVKIAASEQFCLDREGQSPVVTEKICSKNGTESLRIGNSVQNILNRDGDDLRIDWGYFYLTAENARYTVEDMGGMKYICAECDLDTSLLFSFAYDDIKCIEYFGKPLEAYWKKDGAAILDVIDTARDEYMDNFDECRAFSDRLFLDAVRAGGEKYAELISLAFRQVIAGHKLTLDEDGEILFISKECYSNGCAATVDVSYPSIPMFLLYNPELVRGMMRPIYKYAASDAWKYDFAPHDAGRYPKINGQVYGLDRETGEMRYEKQMPVEECGNMLIMEAASAVASGDVSFAKSHLDVLEDWVKYLEANGEDPENQLCTDDFAGHLAHNCNLTLKAIMGIASLGIIYDMLGRSGDCEKKMEEAREMAKSWAVRASNGDGSYRLAFDREGTFSMKYNIVWDKLFGTNIMDKSVIASEVMSYRRRTDTYGLPLDNRKPYTKSDWLVWTATLAGDRKTFEEMIEPMWNAFNTTEGRVPMTDWYYTVTGLDKTYGRDHIISFRHRTVQGGLFIKLLEYKGIMKLDK